MHPTVKTGLDIFENTWPKQLTHARVGLLVHPASVNAELLHSSDLFFQSKKLRLTTLFGPQHGIRGETQDNMIEWEGFRDQDTGLPVYSLYGETRQPKDHMLSDIDAFVVDLQDVGARYYTFIWTLALAMAACYKQGKSFVVLDRPNPIGGQIIEGPILKPEYRSFVGLHPLPIRHGMTIGEIAFYLKESFYQNLDLHIISMQGWTRKMWFENTKLPWVLPSPNIPTNDSAVVYPGMCLLEGTNLSEGRGTTRPFEIFGAPFIQAGLLLKQLSEFRLPGAIFRPVSFMPTFQKYAGEICGGAQIHVLDRKRFKPFLTAVCIIKAVRELWGDKFAWKKPPYEYEEKLLPFDILAGTDRVRKELEKGTDPALMELWWNNELESFNEGIRKRFLLY